MSKNVTATFTNSRMTTYSDIPLWQWDHGIGLTIKGLDIEEAPEVHFTTNFKFGSEDSLLVTTSAIEDGIISCEIPDKLLTDEYNVAFADAYYIIAWVYCNHETIGYTRAVAKIRVKSRPKPVGYVYTSEEVKTWDDKADGLELDGKKLSLMSGEKELDNVELNIDAGTKIYYGTFKLNEHAIELDEPITEVPSTNSALLLACDLTYEEFPDDKWYRYYFLPYSELKVDRLVFSDDFHKVEISLYETEGHISDIIDPGIENVRIIEAYLADSDNGTMVAYPEDDKDLTSYSMPQYAYFLHLKRKRDSGLVSYFLPLTGYEERGSIFIFSNQYVTAAFNGEKVVLTQKSQSVSWDDITDKPFETIGDGLSVDDGVLSVDFSIVDSEDEAGVDPLAVYSEDGAGAGAGEDTNE